MRFAYRNAAYRIIHNLRPPKILKEAKHRREGNTEPSDPHTYSQDNRNFVDIHEETEGYSQFWAGYSSALPWEWNTLRFQMQETKRTRECPTVARGQGLSGQWEPDPSSHLPNCCHILSHHYLNTSCGAKTRNTSLHTQLSTSTTWTQFVLLQVQAFQYLQNGRAFTEPLQASSPWRGLLSLEHKVHFSAMEELYF